MGDGGRFSSFFLFAFVVIIFTFLFGPFRKETNFAGAEPE